MSVPETESDNRPDVPSAATRIYGHAPAEVIELLNRRRSARYLAGINSDGHRLGLVIEGGAMRGAISSATVDGLFQLGYGPCFDEVYGTSSGALNAAYFVSGQISLGTTIYYENATDPQFIKLWRWPDPLDINWLMDNWITKGKSLDLDRVMQSGTALFIAVTDVETGLVRYISNRDGRPELIIPALRASCSTPMFVTHQERIDGRLYNDGLIQAGIPAGPAMTSCTHIVAALTRQVGYRKRRSPILGLIEDLRLCRYSTAYRQEYHRRHTYYNASLDALFSGDSAHRTLVLAPGPDDPLIGNSENRTEPLRQAVVQAMDRLADVFGVSRHAIRMYVRA